MDLPQGKEEIVLKWVLKIKLNEEDSIQQHKARLVAKGYSQQLRIEFNEAFALVAQMETIRCVLAIGARMG